MKKRLSPTLLISGLCLLSSTLLHAELEGRPPEVAEGDWRGVRAAYEAARHEIKPVEGGKSGFKAWNPGQGWLIGFDARGFEVKPQQGCWSWGLEMVGSEADQLDATIKERGSRIEFQRGAGVTEWFVNDERGLEQGWTLTQPLADSAIHLRVRGGLTAEVERQSVSFGGELSYSGLKAWDAQGRTVPVWFEAGERADEFAVRFDDRTAQYPVTIDPLAQNAYLKASNTDEDDRFGVAVAISGDTIVVGAFGEDSSTQEINGNQNDNAAVDAGAAYVFVRRGSGWTQEAYLKANNAGAFDFFGSVLAISGDTIVVGAPSEASIATGVNGNGADNTAPGAGAAYVFVRGAQGWQQQAYLKASNTGAGDGFGSAVAVFGNTIVIGAPAEDSNGTPSNNTITNSGAAYVFTRSGDTWTQQAYLKASNIGSNDEFGTAVAVSEHTLVVGARYERSNATGVNGDETNNSALDAGAAYVYVRNGTVWTQQAYLKASNTGPTQEFGGAVGVSGNTVIVGATGESGPSSGVNGLQVLNLSIGSGAAYLFERTGTTWVQQAYLKASPSRSGIAFGQSVALSGDVAVIGARIETSQAAGVNGFSTGGFLNESGAAYVFVRSQGVWVARASLKASNPSAFDWFGGSVAVEGDTVVVGASRESSSAFGINGNQSDNSAANAGAVYAFDLWQMSLSKTGVASTGVDDGRYAKLGPAVISHSGQALWQQALAGAGASRGRNAGLFSTMAPGNLAVDLVLQSGSPLAGFNLPLTAAAGALMAPMVHQAGRGLYQVTSKGSGLNARNNRLLMLDDGVYTRAIFRTGEAQSQLTNAAVTGWRSLLQARGEDAVQVAYQLGNSTLAVVDKTEDTGLLVLSHEGVIQSDVSSREGRPAYGGGGTFGQFGTLNAAAGAPAYHAFVAPLLPTTPGPIYPTVFWRNANGSAKARVTAVGSNVIGAVGTTFRAFTALSATEEGLVLRATLNGASKVSDEVLWMGMGVLARKGEDAVTSGLPGVKIARFLRFWPVDVPGNVQVVAQVQLSGAAGSGVNARNNQALILIQNDFTRYLLLRTGDAVGGIPGATLRSLSAVDVNSQSGHYAVLTALAGVAAGGNQALLTGNTQRGPNNSALRKPQPRLQKGSYYTSFHTPRGFIRSLALKPPVSPTGAGGIGLGQVVSASGNVLVEVTLDGRAVELVNVRR